MLYLNTPIIQGSIGFPELAQFSPFLSTCYQSFHDIDCTKSILVTTGIRHITTFIKRLVIVINSSFYANTNLLCNKTAKFPKVRI